MMKTKNKISNQRRVERNRKESHNRLNNKYKTMNKCWKKIKKENKNQKIRS